MIDTIRDILIIVLLIAANGLFVAAEFCIVAVPRMYIHEKAEKGNRSAKLVNKILHDPNATDRFIATAQLGITAASLALGMYGERVLATWIAELLGTVGIPLSVHAVATILAISIMTYLHIVIGEMVPKAIALSKVKRAALWLVWPVRGFQLLAYPVVVLLNGLGNVVARLFGARPGAAYDHVADAEELSEIVQESKDAGLVSKMPASVMRELVEYTALRAHEVMVPRVRVRALPLGASAEDLRMVLSQEPHTRYPVYSESLDQIVGGVHSRDVLRVMRQKRSLVESDVLRLPFVPSTATMAQTMSALRKAKSHLAVVMDEHGGTAGILSVEDVHEEVVGELTEDPKAQTELGRSEKGMLQVLGTARVVEVADVFGMKLEHDEVDSVSGLVLSLLGRPPKVGDVVTYRFFRFEVAEVRGLGVHRCWVSPPPKRKKSGAHSGQAVSH